MEQTEGAATEGVKEERCALATYVLTEEEYFSSLRHHFGITPARTLGPAVTAFASVALVLVADLSLWVLIASHFKSEMRAPTLFFTAYAAYWLWAHQFKTQRERRDFRRNVAANLELQRKFISQGMIQAVIPMDGLVKHENLSKIEWKGFSKICETSDGFLLYLGPKSRFLWQPTSSFASPQDVEAFKQLAQANGVRFTKGQS